MKGTTLDIKKRDQPTSTTSLGKNFADNFDVSDNDYHEVNIPTIKNQPNVPSPPTLTATSPSEGFIA